MEVSLTPVPRLYTAGLTMPLKRGDGYGGHSDDALAAETEIEGIKMMAKNKARLSGEPFH